jgi:pimeloyl-ACP methyl ester carboxylesterase
MSKTTCKYLNVDGSDIFYREAGNPKHSTIILLHGYPSSSFMFRNLIPRLSDRFHLIAPDFPGFGNSSTLPPTDFDYTFHNLAEITDHFLERLNVDRYSLYLQDYGAPVGFRIASKHPERIDALIVQNGNAYHEGFTSALDGFREMWKNRTPETEATMAGFFAPQFTKAFYTEGARNSKAINPDNWNMDQFFLGRPVNHALHIELFYDYRKNPQLYDRWHEYFRKHQPPTLIVWGKGDPFFGPAGAKAYLKDLPNAELHMLDTGHTALEEDGEVIAKHIERFLTNNCPSRAVN